MKAVSDTGPLIALTSADLLTLLPSLFGEILIPPEVQKELAALRTGKAGVEFPPDVPWLRMANVRRPELLGRFLMPGLSRTDASVLALAVDQGATVVLADDRRTRKVGLEAGLPIIGTGGILIKAKDAAMIPAVKPVLDTMIRSGIYIGHDLYQEMLRRAGER